MIALLNYLPVIIWMIGVAIMAYFFFKKDNVKATIITAGVLIVIALGLKALTPSYMPKGTVPPMPIIQPEVKELPPVVDRTLKPEMTNEERAKRFDEKFDAVKQSQ